MFCHTDESEDVSEKEKINVRYVIRKSWPYFRSELKTLMLGVVLLGILTLFELALPILLKTIIDNSLKEKEFSSLIKWSLLYLVIFIAGLGVDYGQVVNLSKMGLRIVTRIKTDLFVKLVKHDLKFLNQFDPGRLISRIEGDAENVKQLFSNVVLNMIKSFLVFNGILVVLFLNEPKVTLYVSALVPICIATTYFMMRFLVGYYRQNRKIMTRLSGFMSDYLQNVEVVRVFNYVSHVMKRLKSINRERKFNDVKLVSFENGYMGVFLLFEVIAISIVLLVGGAELVKGTMTVGTLVMFIEFIRRLFQPIMEFNEYVGFIQKAFVSAGRIFHLMDEPVKVSEVARPKELEGIENRIEFCDVHFSYDDKTQVLGGVSFDIPIGKKVALVGASGAGKSTIVSLLMRFYDPTAGIIRIDGVDIRELSLTSLRSKMGLVNQEMFFFSGSIKENIKALNENIGDEAVFASSDIVGISPLIASKEKSFETEIAEKGGNLSVGEKQLLSFARALAISPEVLVLDEATSAVDPQTELLIDRALSQAMNDRTSLIVAHRLSTIRRCDEILVFEKGVIVERGTHTELLKREGTYKRMYQLQEF